MKIGIDARFIGPQGTGLGKYTEKLIQNLASVDKLNSYVIFLRKSNWDLLDLPDNFKKVAADIPWYGLEEQIKLPKILNSQNLDLLHIPHFNAPLMYRGKFIVTIHDLIHHQFSESSVSTRNKILFKLKRAAYKLVITSAVKRSQKIICPSNYVKTQIVETFKINPQKIVVTHEAAEEEYFEKSTVNGQLSTVLEKFSIRKPFLIYVGNAYPHKNLDNLLQALKILTISNQQSTINNLQLVIVCARDVFYQRLADRIKKLGLEDKVTLTGFINSKDLAQIFKAAQAYIFPTLSEGFGIPGLNAMAAGLPVAASNIPALKEVYGDAALYFDPHNPKDIAQKIRKIISDSHTRSDLVRRGMQQVKIYSWRQMAVQTLEVYENYETSRHSTHSEILSISKDRGNLNLL